MFIFLLLVGEDGDDESIYEESDDVLSDEESDDEVDFSSWSQRIKLSLLLSLSLSLSLSPLSLSPAVSRRKAKSAKSKSDDIPPLLAKMNNTIHVSGFGGCGRSCCKPVLSKGSVHKSFT